MAAKVRVFNDNTHPLHEIFKGEEVKLESKDYWRDKNGKIKEMDIYEANDFRGQYHAVPFDGSGKMLSDSKYYKMIKIEKVSEESALETAANVFTCMMKGCKHVSPSTEELDAHVKVRHPSAETLILPEEDAHIKAKKTKTA